MTAPSREDRQERCNRWRSVVSRGMCFGTASCDSHSGRRGTEVAPVGPAKDEPRGQS